MATFSDERLTTHPSLDAASEAAAELISREITRRLATEEQFHLVVTGGRSPVRLYQRLAQSPLPWSRVNFFWSDERAVPPEHPESNYRLVREHLLDGCDHNPSQVFRMPGEVRPLSTAAAEYEGTLRKAIGDRPFDLALLGMGEDGHIGSLFPGSPQLLVRDRSVVFTTESPKPPAERLSLTITRLAAARRIIIFTSGTAREELAREVLAHPESARDRWPVALLPLDRTSFIVAAD